MRYAHNGGETAEYVKILLLVFVLMVHWDITYTSNFREIYGILGNFMCIFSLINICFTPEVIVWDLRILFLFYREVWSNVPDTLILLWKLGQIMAEFHKNSTFQSCFTHEILFPVFRRANTWIMLVSQSVHLVNK